MGSETWWEAYKYPWWARILAAVLVLASVFPIPVWFYKNWPKNALASIKTYLSNSDNYALDPSNRDPSRRVSVAEMEKIIRAEDKALLKKALAEEGDKRFASA